MQWEIAGNINVSVERSMIKLSGSGSTIRFPNTHAVVLILPLYVSKKISLLSQASGRARLEVQRGKRNVNSVPYCHAAALLLSLPAPIP